MTVANRSLRSRCIAAFVGALLGFTAGVIGGAETADILLWGVLPGAVVGFVGGWLLDVFVQFP